MWYNGSMCFLLAIAALFGLELLSLAGVYIALKLELVDGNENG